MSGLLIKDQLNSLESTLERLNVRRDILLNKALHSTHPSDVIKASKYIQGVESKQTVDRKAYLIDPYQFSSFLGYKDKPYSLSYGMLKKMSYTVPIIRAVIGTRIDQAVSFCEPQKNKYAIGFVIRKKKTYFNNEEENKVTKEEANKIEELTEFILNCGVEDNKFEGDDFDDFIKKILNDSLTYDQMTFEVVDDNKGRPHSFYAVDASTIRVAQGKDDHDLVSSLRPEKLGKKPIKNYYPAYCQLRDSSPVADFYPWQMCFGIRNPTTNIYANGYGVSELEILMNTITSMLWSDDYNRRFFSQGSAPKGLLKIKSGAAMGDTTINQFRQQWQAMMAGVYNSWKTPILEGDIDWIDLQKSNNDMEFAKWQEYLIKLVTAIYRIDPAEINFPLSGGSEKPMFEGNNEARLKHSKDKGLYPLLRFIQKKINKYIISRLDPRFEFVFEGLDVDDPKDELEADIKMMTNFMTVDEVRLKRGLKPLGAEKGGDMIANSVIVQAMNAQKQQEMMKQQMEQGGGQPGMMGGEEEGAPGGNEEGEEEEDQNPFEKAFDKYIETLNAA